MVLASPSCRAIAFATAEANCGGRRRVVIFTFGAWRSLVALLLWEQEVGGSNPLAPTSYYKNLATSYCEIHSIRSVIGCPLILLRQIRVLLRDYQN